jgi:tRNA (guanine37-N1)-methyltransferase
MRFDVMTLFPDMMRCMLEESVIGRAWREGLFTVRIHNIRDFSEDKHHRVDDVPYGGGGGMVMEPRPRWGCYRHLAGAGSQKARGLYVSPRGGPLPAGRAGAFML